MMDDDLLGDAEQQALIDDDYWNSDGEDDWGLDAEEPLVEDWTSPLAPFPPQQQALCAPPPLTKASTPRTVSNFSMAPPVKLSTPTVSPPIVQKTSMASTIVRAQRQQQPLRPVNQQPLQLKTTAASRSVSVEQRARANAYLLHCLCLKRPTARTAIGELLDVDAEAARRRLPDALGRRLNNPYTLPINLALTARAPLAVIELLASSAPDTLAEVDGPRRESSLHVAIQASADPDVIDTLLLAWPKSAGVIDAVGNSVLHLACSLRATEASIIRHVFLMNEASAILRDRQDRRPIDILIGYQKEGRPVAEAALRYLASVAR